MPTMSKLLQDVAAAVRANAEELTDLDRAIGDGDHGANLRRGFDAVAELAPELDAMPPGQALQKAGMTLVMKVGGASGPLYGSLLMGIGKSLAGVPTAGASTAGALTRLRAPAPKAPAAGTPMIEVPTHETPTPRMPTPGAPTAGTPTAEPPTPRAPTHGAPTLRTPSPTEVADALQAGVDMVRQRGKSDVGDKTMLDVLAPVCEALRDGLSESLPLPRLLDDVSAAASRGLESTRALQARKGRASFLGERSVGHLDPGARSSQLIVERVCASLRGES